MGELKIFWNVERQQINRMKLLNRARCGGSSRDGSSSSSSSRGYTDQIKDSMENLNGAPTLNPKIERKTTQKDTDLKNEVKQANKNKKKQKKSNNAEIHGRRTGKAESQVKPEKKSERWRSKKGQECTQDPRDTTESRKTERKKKWKEGRKRFAENENKLKHFSNVEKQSSLETGRWTETEVKKTKKELDSEFTDGNAR
ncbi:hypothetical protein RUM43_008746 [Polyplax serrata]|uniref:Uncharacterized protein n=1 Tax=Polyplax serrata TaxID=468196 RepID=A0AAN8S422_POLSC